MVKRLFIAQDGRRIWASTRKELAQLAGYSKVSIMYRDKKDGRVVRVGYVVGPLWFTEYAPVERPA